MSDGGSTINGTTLTISNITNFLYNYNQTATLYFYNQTSSPYFYNQTQNLYFYNQSSLFSYNHTIISNAYTDIKVGTADLHNHNSANITSPIWINKTGDTMTGNLNMSTNNVTSVNCIVFNSGGRICSA